MAKSINSKLLTSKQEYHNFKNSRDYIVRPVYRKKNIQERKGEGRRKRGRREEREDRRRKREGK